MRNALVSLVAALLLPSCGGDGDASDAGSSAPDASADAPFDVTGHDATQDVDAEPDAADAAPPVCGTGNRSLPSGLVEVAWDDGEPVGDLRG
jgi:hypothetical protein